MTRDRWASKPSEWHPLFRAWAAKHSDTCALHETRQHYGGAVLGLTIAEPACDPVKRPFRLVAAVPHAHEPAGTAACVNVACELLTGKHLDGSPSDLPREEVLSKAVVTLLPDTNPEGRARSPESVWDGRHDNDYFLKVAFGITRDGQRFGRYPEWRVSEHHPRQIGIIYEQLADDVWAESNTNRASGHARALDALFAQYRYTHYLSMHQHESEEGCYLPAEYDDLPEASRDLLLRWSAPILKAWRQAGSNPHPEPVVPYKGGPRQQLFKDFWGGRCPGMLKLTVEVRNNCHSRTDLASTRDEQFRYARTALVTTLERGPDFGGI